MVPSRRVYQLLLLCTAIGLGLTVDSDGINQPFLSLAILLTLGFDDVVVLLAVLDGQ